MYWVRSGEIPALAVAVADAQQDAEAVRVCRRLRSIQCLDEVFERRGEVLGIEVHFADFLDRRVNRLMRFVAPLFFSHSLSSRASDIEIPRASGF
jgi:hypothetical protein